MTTMTVTMTMESVGERSPDTMPALTPNLAHAQDKLWRAFSALNGIVHLLERYGVILKDVSFCREGMHFAQGIGSRVAFFSCGIRFIVPSSLDVRPDNDKTNVAVAVMFTLMQTSERVELTLPTHETTWQLKAELQERLLAEHLNTVASWEERRKWYTAHDINGGISSVDQHTAERLIVALALRTQER